MKKFKVLKIFLPLICIGIFVAAAVWLQSTGWIGNWMDSLEDALQAVLGGSPDPVNQDFTEDKSALNAILNETATRKLPEALMNPGEATFGMEDAGETVSALSTRDLPLPLRDLYGAPGQTVRFHVYHPGTVNYTWEYYDMASRTWRPIAENLAGSERDALGRMTAYADFETPAGQPELMIRCLYETENAAEMAFLRALPQEIRQIALADESIAVEAGSYLASCDIAVKVTYADDTSDIIDGLYGLYFMESEAETESSEFIYADGTLTERKVQTILNHFCPYRSVSAGEEIITLAYISDMESPRLLLSGTVTGTDEEPPAISKVDILIREDVPDTDGETSVTFLVTAEDNVSPYPRLQYAVKNTADEANIGEITEEDWLDSPKFTMTLQGSSPWILYCRDQAGNVSVYKQEDIPEEPPILAEEPKEPPDGERDTQAPVIRNIYVEAD